MGFDATGGCDPPFLRLNNSTILLKLMPIAIKGAINAAIQIVSETPDAANFAKNIMQKMTKNNKRLLNSSFVNTLRL